MERDSFIFYRSFYEATAELPKDIRLEVLIAIMEYALFGRQPESLRPFAKGMFTLIKPNIDVNTKRLANGKKGGRRPAAAKPSAVIPARCESFDQEIARMKEDTSWIEQGVCLKFGISPAEAFARLDRFLTHCNTECADKPHPSYGDAQRHFCSWLRKLYPNEKNNNHDPAPDQQPPMPDYGFSGGFGGEDV